MSDSVQSTPIMAIGVNDVIHSEAKMPNVRQFVYIGPFRWQEVAQLMGPPPAVEPAAPSRMSTVMDEAASVLDEAGSIMDDALSSIMN